MGNRNVKPAIWDHKTESYIPAHEFEARNARLKSKHLTNPESPASVGEEHAEESDALFDAEGLPLKRRKTSSGLQERVFSTKKWVLVPAGVAEKLSEPKYLADRRPGMDSLYGGAYKATNGFGSLGINPGEGSGAAGYDLGDGTGLGNATGVLNAAPEPAPVRKNMPPKRKKKKLGGPGRKKANPPPIGENTSATQPSGIPLTDTPMETPSNQAASENKPETQQGEADGSDSDSEGEGSEEGEIDEGGKAQDQTHPQPEVVTETGDQIERTSDRPTQQEEQASQPSAAHISTPEVAVIETTASALVSEPTPDLSTAVALPTDTEMQDVIAAQVISQQQETVSGSATDKLEDTVMEDDPETSTQVLSKSTPAQELSDLDASSLRGVAQSAHIADDPEVVHARPVLEQITPEPVVLPQSEIHTTEPSEPSQSDHATQAPSSHLAQVAPEEAIGSTETAVEETTTVLPISALVSDTLTSTDTNPPDKIPAPEDAAAVDISQTETNNQGDIAPPASQPNTGKNTAAISALLNTDPSSEPVATADENIKPTTSIPTKPESSEQEDKPAEFDLLGGLEAAVDKEATANSHPPTGAAE